MVNGLCPVCYGTGIRCGYYSPLEFYLGVVPTDIQRRREPDRATVEDVALHCVGLSWPALETPDVWIRLDDDTRFIVDRVKPTMFRGIPITQTVLLRQASVTDIVYRLPRSGPICPGEDAYGYDGYAYV